MVAHINTVNELFRNGAVQRRVIKITSIMSNQEVPPGKKGLPFREKLRPLAFTNGVAAVIGWYGVIPRKELAPGAAPAIKRHIEVRKG